jgi:hypothetical protein
MSHAESNRSREVLRELWCPSLSEALWEHARGLDRVSQAEVLFSFVREYEKNPDEARVLVASTQTSCGNVRGVRITEAVAGAPHQPGEGGQQAREYPDPMQMVSRLSPLNSETKWVACSWEDGVPRVAKGVAARVDRLRCLGNAVVPQVAEFIGRMILAAARKDG